MAETLEESASKRSQGADPVSAAVSHLQFTTGAMIADGGGWSRGAA